MKRDMFPFRGVPYDTGKVKIGWAYVPPRKVVGFERDADLLQRALLSQSQSVFDRMKRWALRSFMQ
jgi:hypothetical protein